MYFLLLRALERALVVRACVNTNHIQDVNSTHTCLWQTSLSCETNSKRVDIWSEDTSTGYPAGMWISPTIQRSECLYSMLHSENMLAMFSPLNITCVEQINRPSKHATKTRPRAIDRLARKLQIDADQRRRYSYTRFSRGVYAIDDVFTIGRFSLIP